mmetsp:Transcript_11467/g.12392  ORF Transcript_11467/g.12392 Transcript_11467/m.12392 type:complete len:86 (-) Transcript_11467:558-815(-)
MRIFKSSRVIRRSKINLNSQNSTKLNRHTSGEIFKIWPAFDHNISQLKINLGTLLNMDKSLIALQPNKFKVCTPPSMETSSIFVQ